MTIHSSFTPAFFHPDPNSFTAISDEHQTEQAKPVLFSDQKYRAMPMREFMAHPDFTKCQQEYAALADHISGFVRVNADKVVPTLSTRTTDSIKNDFDELKKHLSNLTDDFFSTHKPVVYGPGKEMFHELENLLGNEKIPLQKRIDAIVAMAPQMRVCSGGMLTVLQQAISSLKHSTTGLKGAAYRAKIQMMDALITNYAKKNHDYHTGNEVHFVNAYFNYMAKSLGVSERMDKFTTIAESQISVEQFEDCKNTVLAKLNPTKLAAVMAEDYLDQVKGAQQGDLSQPVENERLTDVFNRDENIKRATLNSAFGLVPTENYLLQVPDTYSYQFTRHPALVAKHFMETMRSSGLVNYDDTIALKKDEENGTIKMLGNLFWRDNGGSCEELKAEELLAISPQNILLTLDRDGIDQKEHGAVLQEIAQHILDAREVENIQHIPDAWLEHYADIFSEKKISESEGTLGLMLAATFNSTNGVKRWINAGINIDVKDNEGLTAAMIAAKNGHVDVLKALIAAKADINSKDSRNATAAMLAAQNGHVDALKALIAAKADINVQSLRGFTAAILAAQKGHADVLNVLIAAKADINVKNKYGITAAMIAAYNGHADALKALIAAKADINVIVKMFSPQGVLQFTDAIQITNDAKIRQRMKIVNTIAPHLNRSMRHQLLNNIRRNHGSRTILGRWKNHAAYDNLKINNPELYSAFKTMKGRLK